MLYIWLQSLKEKLISAWRQHKTSFFQRDPVAVWIFLFCKITRSNRALLMPSSVSSSSPLSCPFTSPPCEGRPLCADSLAACHLLLCQSIFQPSPSLSYLRPDKCMMGISRAVASTVCFAAQQKNDCTRENLCFCATLCLKMRFVCYSSILKTVQVTADLHRRRKTVPSWIHLKG